MLKLHNEPLIRALIYLRNTAIPVTVGGEADDRGDEAPSRSAELAAALVRSLFCGLPNKERRMAIFVSFSDESETAGFFHHAGLIAWEKEWDKVFVPAWQKYVLDRPPKIEYLHMTEIRSRAWREKRGLSPEEAELRVNAAVNLICKMNAKWAFQICSTTRTEYISEVGPLYFRKGRRWRPPAVPASRYPGRVPTGDWRSSRASNGHFVDLDGGDSHTHRHALPVLAAGADAFVQPQVVAHHTHVLQRFRPVADQRGIAHRARQLAVLDKVALRRREDEVAAGDIHLTAPEVHAVESLGHRADDFFRIALPCHHERIRHPRHGNVGIAFAPPAARRLRSQQRARKLVRSE